MLDPPKPSEPEEGDVGKTEVNIPFVPKQELSDGAPVTSVFSFFFSFFVFFLFSFRSLISGREVMKDGRNPYPQGGFCPGANFPGVF